MPRPLQQVNYTDILEIDETTLENKVWTKARCKLTACSFFTTTTTTTTTTFSQQQQQQQEEEEEKEEEEEEEQEQE